MTAVNSYFVALFDVLGFEDRFRTLGLREVATRYEVLVDVVNRRNSNSSDLENFFNCDDETFWAAEGEVIVLHRVFGAYASDSLLLWAHQYFPEGRDVSDAERGASSGRPADGWKYHSIPCEFFLDDCCEVICRSIEVGLPVRGAIALGPAIMSASASTFLGLPLIETARLEKEQRLIGASFTKSFTSQVIPDRYALLTWAHMKSQDDPLFSGFALDWPRHWRRTRKRKVQWYLDKLNTKPAAAVYYEKTAGLCGISEAKPQECDSKRFISLRSTYPQFASEELMLPVRAVLDPSQPPNKSFERTREG